MTSGEEAIKKTEGPCLILAGAGTGKTYTIVEKIKYLVENNVYDTEKIVCITFSNEAANNLTLRLNKILKNKIPIIRTFHGFSADLLREKGDKIKINKDFKILDPDQAKVLLHRSLKVLPANCHRYISTIGTSKDLGVSIDDYKNYLAKESKKYEGVDLEKRVENLSFELQTMHLSKIKADKALLINEIKRIKNIIEIKKFINIWSAYEKLKQKGNYLDYSDLNLYSLILFEKFPELSKDFSYIIVDEFQDTNKLQLDFLIKLAPHNNITAVGDINQSIYRFRGAYKENLNIFKEKFHLSQKDIFNLTKSFRSPNVVLRAAHKLISNNYKNKEECFFVENASNIEGEKIKIFELKNAKEEARKVVELIKEKEKTIELEEICIMFRAHQNGRIIKKALEEAGIAYYSVSKSSLLKQKSVKTVIDFLTVINKLKKKDSGGEEAWWDLLYQFNFSQEDLKLIGKTIKDFLKDKTKIEKLSVYLFNNLENLNFSEVGKISIKTLIEKIKLLLPSLEKKISELIQEVYKVSGLLNENKTREQKEIMLNLIKFNDIAKAHEELYDSDVSNFLYYLDILKELDIDIDAPDIEEKGVRLMTSHSTKGLEFKVVIITNLAEGRFPLNRYVSNSLMPTELLPEIKEEIKGMKGEEIEDFIAGYQKANQLEEERRLAYVSFTRAKENLFLTYAEEYSSKKSSASSFLKEINYKSSEDVIFEKDSETKYAETSVSIKSASFASALSSSDFKTALDILASTQKSVEQKKLSPSSLKLFTDCQKEFEYRYVFNMPERKKFSWEAIQLGSFVHIVLERGVKSNYKDVDDFLHFAKELIMDEEWSDVNFEEAKTLIRVFFERHKGKYSKDSKTEQFLSTKLGGMDFIGFADRIDYINDGIQIVDYKTGKTAISPKDRDWQLGFYALAAAKLGKVKKIILDMLRQEKPLEFEIDDKGNATCASSDRISGFNIYEVEKDLIDTAKKIEQAHKIGFKPCPVEKNCEFCSEYVYNL